MQESIPNLNNCNELNVSFGYQCNDYQNSTFRDNDELGMPSMTLFEDSNIKSRSGSFSCLSGAALSANVTLLNTTICNGRFGEELLPSLDSPKSFRRMRSSTSMPKLDVMSSSSSHVSLSTMAGNTSTDIDITENSGNFWKPTSAPTIMQTSSFLNAMDVQMAGGAAGEDRVQAVCSELNGWLFCGIYDGFNGRDAADFLAGILYERIQINLLQLELHMKQNAVNDSNQLTSDIKAQRGALKSELSWAINALDHDKKNASHLFSSSEEDEEFSCQAFCTGVLDSLTFSLAEAENDFMSMVEETMEDRPDLVSVGSCVLVVLLHMRNLFVMNLGDSRAVLASCDTGGTLHSTQLTETHTVDNELEHMKVVSDHPDDPAVISGGRVKGKLKLTRAFGVGYLKRSHLNDALMGILQVHNLQSPPYIYAHPYTLCHQVSNSDLFMVLGSDGLFDFFTNQEVVEMVNQFIQCNPYGDPAKHLIERLILRAAENAGFSTEELMNIPAGGRRKYHGDVTVIVIIFGNKQRTTKASTPL
ncbi:hypothetical protein HPP92_021207 [Vanilla planifolia]|uniref:protein-serine/threonine phosphatase n=1 Tax=Vanilla planifolia TaxID=51239 RepID=A0A835UKH7_VANPL|nr:hypothetical protein HPP92_021207 [Vanilla planifolia]